ncbi:hypothetical protein DUNSADRAFT_18523 [Dunaliella salina]|uniref:Encoded protein n=1 Tax=Dunaliella salina TaxID=3046 RepID=A0ABQ7FZZ7_DUNSA|nr:hypothetical protein DUNSADRAFT_18523 [Dunaliella salina]|eukprot:KAF5827929.1 hypothetical protein DUNSADRAFT_18523 [Dunaliella salina]
MSCDCLRSNVSTEPTIHEVLLEVALASAGRPASSTAEPEAAKRPTPASRARPSPTPAGNKSDDEEDESLYPRARRLVKDTPRKPAAAAAGPRASRPASKDSSDDDVPVSRGAARPASSASAAGSGSRQPGGSTAGRAPAGSSKASNPILAMLDDDDDDDDFLKGVAPPKKDTSPPPAARTTGIGATREGPGHRSASPHSGMGGRGGGGGTAAGRGSSVGRSMDTLANFLKDDEPGLEISLNMGDDGGDALDVLGGPKPAAAPKQGRRRGGGPQGSTPGTGDVSPISGQATPSGVPGGSTQPFPLSERQKFTDEVGKGVREAGLPADRQGVPELQPSTMQQVSLVATASCLSPVSPGL